MGPQSSVQLDYKCQQSPMTLTAYYRLHAYLAADKQHESTEGTRKVYRMQRKILLKTATNGYWTIH